VPQSAKLTEFKRVESQVGGLEKQVKDLEDERHFRNFWLEEMALVNDARPKKLRVWFSAFESSSISEANSAGAARPRGTFAANRATTGAGADPNAPTVAQDKIVSTGFPGVTAQTAGLSGGGINFGGDDEDDDDRGRGRNRSRPNARATDKPELPPRPNGVRVIGFAESSEAIQEFVENLKIAERTLANKDMLKVKAVHFSEASVRKVPQEVLYQAWTTSESSSPMGSQSAASTVGPAVFSFEVNLEFDSPYYAANPTSGAPAPAAGAARPGLTSPSLIAAGDGDSEAGAEEDLEDRRPSARRRNRD
jgi:hypothetical protein